jgi:hypothetical protein
MKPRLSGKRKPEQVFDLRERQDDAVCVSVLQVLVQQRVLAGHGAPGGSGASARASRRLYGVAARLFIQFSMGIRTASVHPAHAARPAAGPSPAASGICDTSASVVSMSDAMDAAFCSAVRTTFVGSITPAVTRFSYLSFSALKPSSGPRPLHLGDDNGAFLAGVAGDPTNRLLDRSGNDLNADLLFAVELQRGERLRCPEQRDAAARNDALFDGRLRGVHGIFHARLFFLQFGLGRRARP